MAARRYEISLRVLKIDVVLEILLPCYNAVQFIFSVSNNILEQLRQFFYSLPNVFPQVLHCFWWFLVKNFEQLSIVALAHALFRLEAPCWLALTIILEWRNAYVISLRLLTYPMHNQYFCHEKISTILFYYLAEFCTNTLLDRLAHNASLVIQSPTCFPFQYKY